MPNELGNGLRRKLCDELLLFFCDAQKQSVMYFSFLSAPFIKGTSFEINTIGSMYISLSQAFPQSKGLGSIRENFMESEKVVVFVEIEH